MTASQGEGMQHAANFDALLNTPAPTFELMDPKTAPADMLDQVRVDTRGRCLETETPLGTIAVEMYWTMGEGFDGVEESRGDFFPALDAGFDPNAATNPSATQRYPYTILPDGALYQMAVRVPLDAAAASWSEERTHSFGEGKMFAGISLGEFRRAFPDVEVDLPEGRYSIDARERTKPILALAARVENGEPLMRTQEVSGSAIRYKETPMGGFMESGIRPDTAVALIDCRTTIRAGTEEADRQTLEFRTHDGFQRTGEGAAEHSGLAEIIVMQAEAVQYSGFTFTPYRPPIIANLQQHSYGGYGSYGPASRRSFMTRDGGIPLSFGTNTEPQSGGLTGGETRYRQPEAIKVSLTGIRNVRAIAAFRFAMTGSQS